MVFIRRPRCGCEQQRTSAAGARTQKSRNPRVSECSSDTGTERICKSLRGNAPSCFKRTQILSLDLWRSSVFHKPDSPLKKGWMSNAICVKYWVDAGKYCSIWFCDALSVLTIKQISCDLHSKSYLNLGTPSHCLSLLKKRNQSNGNRLDVTESLSLDWQENSHE